MRILFVFLIYCEAANNDFYYGFLFVFLYCEASERLVSVSDNLPHSRCDNDDLSVDHRGNFSELGVGIPLEDSDMVSFNVNVERHVSNISPSSSVDMIAAVAEQQENDDSDAFEE